MKVSSLTLSIHRFITTRWKQSEDGLCVLLPKLSSLGCFTRSSASCGLLPCPTAWQLQMKSNFLEQLENDDIVPMCCAYLDLMVVLSLEQPLVTDIKDCLGRHAKRSLSSAAHGTNSDYVLFGVGRALHSYIKTFHGDEDLDLSLWPLLCSAAPNYRALPLFLESLYEYIRKTSGQLELSATTVEALEEALVSNLTTPSHDLRLLSLRILGMIHRQRYQQDSEAIVVALRIEETPLSLETARSASMYIRKLASLYESTEYDPLLHKIVPYYCFGIFTMQLSQLWVDAKNALKVVCENQVGEGIVTELAFSLLASPTVEASRSPCPARKASQKMAITEFQCSNLASLESLAEEGRQDIAKARDVLRDRFYEAHRVLPLTTSAVRTQVLDVLNTVPYIAEKRSRYLVPVLLSWTASKDEEAVSSSTEDSIEPDTITEERSAVNWTTREKKAMLGLFEQFKNPAVIYKSAEVYKTLLNLVVNGDTDMQKCALKVIFTWKSSAFRPYQEILLNVLDEARFRDEISKLTQTDDTVSIVQSEHREIVMPVLLRLLYGKMVAKQGSASGRRGQESKRKAVLAALAQFEQKEIGLFVGITLGPLESLSLIRGDEILDKSLEQELLGIRKQVGLIKMLENMIEILGNRLEPFVGMLLNAVLYCLIRASHHIQEASEAQVEEMDSETQLSMLKTIRQTGFKCLNLLFKSFPAFGWQIYIPPIVEKLITPRIERLPIETAQAVSVLLQVFSTWSTMQETVLFFAADDGKMLRKIADCLEVPSAKDEVKLFVLENILRNIIRLATRQVEMDKDSAAAKLSEEIQSKILRPRIDYFLARIGALVRGSPSKEVLGSGVLVVSELAEFVTGSSQARNLVEVAAFLLDQPAHRVNPKTKSDLLRILQHFLPQYNLSEDEDLGARIFRTVSSLFGYFKDRKSRETLCRVLSVLAHDDANLAGIAELCTELNAFSTQSLSEPDFDRRLRAFALINESQYSSFTLQQWRPILFNMIYYIRDEDELAIRTNASLTLRRFIQSVPMDPLTPLPAATDLIKIHLLPSLRKGAHESSELVRAEYLAVMACLIKQNPDWPEVNDMRVLLVDDDDEASFFNNVLHIQQHRRLRALRRLAMEARQGRLGSTNISQFFIPLIEHFIFDKTDDESAHNLAAETVQTIGALVEWLEWPQFRATFRRYSGYIESKPEMEKTMVKLLGALIDALSRASHTKQGRFLLSKMPESSVATTSSVDPDAIVNAQPLEHTLAANQGFA